MATQHNPFCISQAAAQSTRRYVLTQRAREIAAKPQFDEVMSFMPHAVFKAIEPVTPLAESFIEEIGKACNQEKPLRMDEVATILVGAFGDEAEVSHALVGGDLIRLVPRAELSKIDRPNHTAYNAV